MVRQQIYGYLLTPPGGASVLLGIDAFSAASAVAVGYFTYLKTGWQVPLIERWNGRTWRAILITRELLPHPVYTIVAVAGRSCADTWFVGSDYIPPAAFGSGYIQPIIYHC